MKAEQLHLIVHPGFIAESEDRSLQQGKEIMGAAQAMRAHYVDRIGKMLPTEVAICMLHIPLSKAAKKPKNTLFRQLIDDFREMLGKRLIMIDQSQGVKNDVWIKEQFERAIRVASSRGISISPGTPTVAYGETLFCCVPNCAERVNTSGNFREKTIIDAAYCDVDIPGGVDSKQVQRELPTLQAHFPHTKFSMQPD